MSDQHFNHRRRFWQRPWPLMLLGLLLATGLVVIFARSSLGGHGDCIWGAPVTAWIDDNGNGQHDANDPPLENVQFQVNDTYNGYHNVGGEAISDWNGRARVTVWLPGCPRARFEVAVTPPPGYRATGNVPIQISGSGYGSNQPLTFLFSRIEGFPVPTPYQARLSCTAYSQSFSDFARAPDGTLWMLSPQGASSFQSATETWQSFPTNVEKGVAFNRIQVGPQDTVWISQRDNAAARLAQGIWTYYTAEKDLLASSEPSIGTTSDGRVWFAPESPPNSLIAFNPTSNTWQAFFADKTYATDSVRLVTDGIVWRAAFGYATKYQEPSPLPNGWKVYEPHIFLSNEIQQLPIGPGWIKTAVIDTNDVLWIAHSFGVTRYDTKAQKFTLYDATSTNNVISEQLEDLALAPDGSVWVASGRDHALAFLLPQSTTSWQRFDPRDGIPDQENIDRVEVDQNNSVWFGFKDAATIARCVRLPQ